jgi:RNase P/RNase MRP subunit p29
MSQETEPTVKAEGEQSAAEVPNREGIVAVHAPRGKIVRLICRQPSNCH